MKENAWNTYTDEDLEMMDALIQGYKFFWIMERRKENVYAR